MTGYRRFGEVLTEALKDPETNAEWERTRVRRDVSILLARYRMEHGLSIADLARALGVSEEVLTYLEAV